jgi:hypothetical protein
VPKERDSVATALAGCGKIRLSFRGGPSRPNPEPQKTGQALVSQAGVDGFGVPSLRSGPGMTAIRAFFQPTALAVSAAPAMPEAAASAVGEAYAMIEAATEIMCEAAAHAMSEAVAEIAVRARIIRSVGPVIR